MIALDECIQYRNKDRLSIRSCIHVKYNGTSTLVYPHVAKTQVLCLTLTLLSTDDST